MELCKNIFRKLTAGLTLLMVGYVFYRSATDMYFCYLSGSTRHISYILIAAAFVLAAVLLLFGGRCLSLSDRKASRGTVFLFGLMVLIQFALIFIAFRHYLPWADSLSVINEAISMSASSSPRISSAGRYFEMYGNNYFFTIVLCYFFKFFRFFGLTSYWTEALFLNTLAMDLGVLFCILTVRKLYGPGKGMLLCFLCLLNPLLYVFIPFVYTNTISIPFTMGIFCTAVLLSRERRPHFQFFYAALEAFLIAVGFQIRVTTIIPVIALGIFFLLNFSFKEKQQPAERISKKLPLLLVFASVFLLLFFGCQTLIRNHVPQELREANFPVTHWVMMGLQGNGGYFSPDEDFTYSIPEKADKVQANLEEIRFRLEALKDLGPSGIRDFIFGKITTTWASEMDGLYLETGRMQAYNPLQKYLFGFKNDLLLYYYQFFKVMLYFFCMVGLLRELFSRQPTGAYPYILTLFGFFLFYLIWEANCRYAICLTLVLCMLAFHGMEGMLEAWSSDCINRFFTPEKTVRFRLLARRFSGILMAAGVLLPCLYAMYRQFPAYTQTFIPKVDYSVITVGRSYHENAVGNLLETGSILTQTFTTDHTFSEVGIYCSYNGSREWSEDQKSEQPYRFRLLGPDGTVLAEELFGAEGSGKYYKLFGFEAVTPSGPTEYTIELSGIGSGISDCLNFIYFDFDTYDYISGAELCIDGQSLHRDLIFLVDYSYNGPYTTPARYMAASTILILFLLGLSVLLLTEKRPRGKFFSSLFGPKLLQ